MPSTPRWPLDGFAFHAHRRAFETDRERDLVLATHGWRTVRLTAARLERHATVAERFTALLGGGAAAGRARAA